ncbi:hypothetical protein PRIPAC_96483 [Pristionchus pacificus]|uniref:Ion channel n=1 Tax=Pristionchus pacificus TaxID=54126 RepID=A0A2A6B2S3_PRIPA|nr:hypothetical protein PRIPAC_96483 [Pristionchus pacificus]|eukprot:PDM60174.1 ion channel [Pristionchus pacificus]
MDFKQHVDPEFGNCYTFNYDPKNNLSSSRAGPMYGIRVLLFVNTSDYMSTSESAGIRLAIHPATQYPFPNTFGYSAPVGFASSFGIKKMESPASIHSITRGVKEPVVNRVKDFADRTTAHGAKHVLEARTTFGRVSWLTLIIVLLCVVVLVVFMLVDKYSRHDTITLISIKFDEADFPAVTFCNLNPYKKSLISLIPSVKDTMDVFDNARSSSKAKNENSLKSRRSQLIEMRARRVKELFKSEFENDATYKSNAITTNRLTRNKRQFRPPSQVYEAIEAHCLCLEAGHSEMECIRFESPPKKENSKCICTVWYNHMCPVCSEKGLCETKSSAGTVAQNSSTISSINEVAKPYCIRKARNTRRLWEMVDAPEKMAVVAKEVPKPPTTTVPPRATPVSQVSKKTKIRSQRPIVSEPETISAMGFAEMSDGVAMLTQARQNLMFTMAALSREQRIALSQDLDEFIEMCSFDGKDCDIQRDFKLHVDPEFGNCYTFNYDRTRNLSSSRSGPMYGIRVLLFVNSSDYISTTESTGVRLAIHPASQYPFPATFGYSAPVGFASSFGIKKLKIERLTGYGDCAENGCHRSCFQNRMLEDCDCGDPRFPVPQGQRHCSAFNATARRYLESKIGKGDLHHVSAWASDCDCKHPCKEVVYSMAFSTSKWPSGSTDQLGDCEGMSPSECEVFYRKNAAMVEVYYEQLNYELLQESEAYGIVNLIADFGGHLGLWLGFSVITIVEVLALIVDLVQACFRRRQERKRSEILMKNAV